MGKNLVKTVLIEGIVIPFNKGYLLKCPLCKNNRWLKTKENVRRSIKYNKNCNSCAQSINKTGIKLSDKTKNKMSLSQTKRYSNIHERMQASEIAKIAMHRPDVRIKHINALHHSKWIKVRTDKGQSELLEKWNRLGFQFEPNYQLKTDLDLFYIDGYDINRNIVMEYDGKYHNKTNQRKKDLIRQNKIISILNPKKFWRYDSINRIFNDIYI